MTPSTPRPPAIALAAGVVDLWVVPLEIPLAEQRALTESLDDAERSQWVRRHQDGDRWAVARGARRHVLASYLGVSPAGLRFERGPFGKPWLADHDALRFSASARGVWAVLAVSNGLELGADLESEDTATDPEQVAREFLSPLECSAIETAPRSERRRAFARAWARHEAVRKLHGTGLGEPPPSVFEAEPLLVRDVPAPEGHAAAVAARDAGWHVRLREFAELLAAR